jgi:hypothetical protein
VRVLIKSACESADPTQAFFPFHHASAFAEAVASTRTLNYAIARRLPPNTIVRTQPATKPPMWAM